MLKSVDILIGLSLVMLVVSLVVTVLTEAATNFLQTRGRNLLEGIAGLLRQIDKNVMPEASRTIAKAILTHPLIQGAGGKYGSVIHREELTALLLELAADEGPNQLEASSRTALQNLLAKNGIKDPSGTMANVRDLALVLETAHPELTNNERFAMAFLQEAPTPFLAKMNGWFDPVIDRVADRFTRSTRIVTFAASLAVAFALQLDTGALINRLNADPVIRQKLVDEAIKLNEQQKQPDVNDTQKNVQNLVSTDIIDMPASFQDWVSRWTWSRFAGVLLTALLLSLGAPFWYNALKNLIRLRSLIAQKDDDQRATRQTSGGGGDSTGATAVAVPLVVTGERGDLASIG